MLFRSDELAFELVDDDADGMGLLHPQVAGEAVGPVAHLAGGVHDPLAGFAVDGGMIFEATAYGGWGEAQYFSDVVDGDVFFSRHGRIGC